MTLFEQINNTTLNILHGVWRSDPPLRSPLPSVLLSFCHFISCALFPWAPYCGLLPLAAVWWGFFCVPPWGSVPSWPPFLFCSGGLIRCGLDLGCALPAVRCPWSWVLLALVRGPSLAVIALCRCFCLRGYGCLSVVVVPLFVGGWASLFLSFVWLLLAPLPCRLMLPFPLRLVPCGVLVQFFRWSLPLGICLLLWRPGCLAFLLGVLLCSVALTSFCLMAAKAFGPVWGLFSLYTMRQVLLGCSVLPRWGIHLWWSRSPIGLR